MRRRANQVLVCTLVGLCFFFWRSTLLFTDLPLHYLNPIFYGEFDSEEELEKRFEELGFKRDRAVIPSNASNRAAQAAYIAAFGRTPELENLGGLRDESVAAVTAPSDRAVLGVGRGTLVPIPGGINSCTSTAGVVIDPQGLFVLTTDSARNQVCVHRNDPTTSALTPVPGSPFLTAGITPGRITVDPAGEFVFVANSGSNNVTVFTLSPDSGNLTPVPGSPFATGSQPLDVSTDGFGRFLYVANNLSNSISAFSINRSNGALTPIAGSPFSMGSFLSRVEADPLGRFLYAMDGQRVFVLSIGATGALTPVSGSPLALNPGTVCILPQIPRAVSFGDPTNQIHWSDRHSRILPSERQWVLELDWLTSSTRRRC